MSNKYNFADSLGSPKIGRTAFDLTESKVFDTDVGTLNVGYFRYVNPGDKFQISQKMIVRLNPLVNPAYVRMYAVCHYFFVPFRQLWKDWDGYITRGADGNDELLIPRMFIDSTGNPVDSYYESNLTEDTYTLKKGLPFLKDSFYENLGLPIPDQDSNTVFNKKISSSNSSTGYIGVGNIIDMTNTNAESMPHNFLYSAYNHIYNNYYMDENLQTPLAYYMVGYNSLTNGAKQTLGINDVNNKPLFTYQQQKGLPTYKLDEINGQEPVLPPHPLIAGLQQVNYKKDYFTAMLPFQQRGTAPAIPVSSQVEFKLTDFNNSSYSDATNITVDGVSGYTLDYTQYVGNSSLNNQDTIIMQDSVSKTIGYGSFTQNGIKRLNNSAQAISVSLTAPEMYLLFALQRWQTVTARAGIRYIEFLQAIYGVSPEPLILQIPKYLGGTREPIIISDVIQQSQTTDDSELGQTAGYGLLATSDFIESETFFEHGLVMSIFHITYEPFYTQGMPRELTYSSNFDWFAPQFVNLADQAVKKQEVYFGSTAENTNIFGYIGQYDELRTSYSKCAGTMRSNTMGDWLAKREYDSNVELNSDFMEVQKGSLRDLFQVQDQKPFIVYLQTEVNAIRPLPYHSEPGLIANNYM